MKRAQVHDMIYWVVGIVVVFIIVFALIKGGQWAGTVPLGG